jgi:hypothetical protein
MNKILAIALVAASTPAFAADFCSSLIRPEGVDRLHGSATGLVRHSSDVKAKAKAEVLEKMADYQEACEEDGGNFESCDIGYSTSRMGSAAFRRVMISANVRVKCSN